LNATPSCTFPISWTSNNRMKIWMKRFRRIALHRLRAVRDSLGATAETKRALTAMPNLQNQEANRVAEPRHRKRAVRPSRPGTEVIFADGGDAAGVVLKESADAGLAETGVRIAVGSGAIAVRRRAVLTREALRRGALTLEAGIHETLIREAVIREAGTRVAVAREAMKGATRAAAIVASARDAMSHAADRAFSGRLLRRRRAGLAAITITDRLPAISRLFCRESRSRNINGRRRMRLRWRLRPRHRRKSRSNRAFRMTNRFLQAR
jgi:hypothetical protein